MNDVDPMRAALEAENAKLREALDSIARDAECSIELYHKNGPEWTSRQTGEEYYSASSYITILEVYQATARAALREA